MHHNREAKIMTTSIAIENFKRLNASRQGRCCIDVSTLFFNAEEVFCDKKNNTVS